jgi:hypothetical protein
MPATGNKNKLAKPQPQWTLKPWMMKERAETAKINFAIKNPITTVSNRTFAVVVECNPETPGAEKATISRHARMNTDIVNTGCALRDILLFAGYYDYPALASSFKQTKTTGCV